MVEGFWGYCSTLTLAPGRQGSTQSLLLGLLGFFRAFGVSWSLAQAYQRCFGGFTLSQPGACAFEGFRVSTRTLAGRQAGIHEFRV